jgi:hypothetical protein
MRYHIRTLLMLMAIGPPMLALGYWRALEFRELWREQRIEAAVFVAWALP